MNPFEEYLADYQYLTRGDLKINKTFIFTNKKCLHKYVKNLIRFVAWNLPESEPEQPDPQASKDDSLREPFEETDPTPE